MHNVYNLYFHSCTFLFCLVLWSLLLWCINFCVYNNPQIINIFCMISFDLSKRHLMIRFVWNVSDISMTFDRILFDSVSVVDEWCGSVWRRHVCGTGATIDWRMDGRWVGIGAFDKISLLASLTRVFLCGRKSVSFIFLAIPISFACNILDQQRMNLLTDDVKCKCTMHVGLLSLLSIVWNVIYVFITESVNLHAALAAQSCHFLFTATMLPRMSSCGGPTYTHKNTNALRNVYLYK